MRGESKVKCPVCEGNASCPVCGGTGMVSGDIVDALAARRAMGDIEALLRAGREPEIAESNPRYGRIVRVIARMVTEQVRLRVELAEARIRERALRNYVPLEESKDA